MSIKRAPKGEQAAQDLGFERTLAMLAQVPKAEVDALEAARVKRPSRKQAKKRPKG